MDTSLFIEFLRELDNLQMFSLCKEFDDLTLEEKEAKVESSSTSIPGSFHSQFISEHLQRPFFEVPRYLIDSLCSLSPSQSSSSPSIPWDNLTMGISYHFIPGQNERIHQEINLPGCLFYQILLVCLIIQAKPYLFSILILLPGPVYVIWSPLRFIKKCY